MLPPADAETWRTRLTALTVVSRSGSSQVASTGSVARWRTRFAPAPTGHLHLGHLVNALHVWGLARAFGGEVLLRVEDHDGTRCRPEYERALLDDLDWLGLEADRCTTRTFRDEAVAHEARQSNQSPRYLAALTQLEQQGLVYVCRCTRREIAQLVPHAPGDEPCYPGTCRAAEVRTAEALARRVRLAPHIVHFDDLRLGLLSQEPAAQCGDLLVRDRHGQWTYQFAVTVDDLAHDIDVVIRGEDLLASTGRQLQLAALLGRPRPPMFLHHTLLVHADGTKLSKATGDTALGDLRRAGLTPAELFGAAAHRAGLRCAPQSIAARDVASLFVDAAT
jgi:glutamyl-tRNA synthetase/glutamyl-Q tRNA(Asp) synthetase